ncbi:MAG: FRG domain-containing protein [Mycoplasmatales bacterium]|nr:FRG domain-containing protein [Mycoplasmatales bacterium]
MDNKRIETISTMNEFHSLLNSFQKYKGLMLFRGQDDFKWELESSWLRSNNSEKLPKKRLILRNNITIFNEYITTITKNKQYSNRGALDILAELQHAKDVPTPLIDFTEDVLAAFWFALSNHNLKHDAALFILKVKNSNRIQKELVEINKTTQNSIFESPFVSTRVLSQRSYFIIDSKNWEEDKNVQKIRIKKAVIENILVYLSQKNKSHKSVYPDLMGEYLNAVSGSAVNYLLKGRLSTSTKDKLKNYMKASSLRPDWSNPYNNIGTTYFQKRKDEKKPERKSYWCKKAIKYFDKSLNLKETSTTLKNKGSALGSLMLHRKSNKKNLALQAIECFDKAISLNNQTLGAHFNKGLVLLNLANTLKRNKEIIENVKKSILCFEKELTLNPLHKKSLKNQFHALELIYKISNTEIIKDDFYKKTFSSLSRSLNNFILFNNLSNEEILHLKTRLNFLKP